MSDERKTQDIGHCRVCKFQWVVKHGIKGKNSSTVRGQVCPDCRSSNIYYTKEDNR